MRVKEEAPRASCIRWMVGMAKKAFLPICIGGSPIGRNTINALCGLCEASVCPVRA